LENYCDGSGQMNGMWLSNQEKSNWNVMRQQKSSGCGIEDGLTLLEAKRAENSWQKICRGLQWYWNDLCECRWWNHRSIKHSSEILETLGHGSKIPIASFPKNPMDENHFFCPYHLPCPSVSPMRTNPNILLLVSYIPWYSMLHQSHIPVDGEILLVYPSISHFFTWSLHVKSS